MNSQHESMLGQLESRSYRLSVDHGLIDILVGAVLIAFGLMLHADLDYMPVIVFFIGAIAYPQARRRLIEPRIGHVRLHADRVARLQTRKWLTFGVLLIAIFGVLALRGLGWIDYPKSAAPLIVTGCFALALAVAAWLFGIRRGFAWAAIVLAGGLIEWRFGLDYGLSWYFSGGLVVLAGLLMLARFMRANPPDTGEPNGA
ncbi:MAG: hypothetical protein LC637_12920 [Xanthomonadaceae bacterium]|nr:hypothetical protein [Xanthomonadaceae bacterium]